jgi:hypothetical protein
MDLISLKLYARDTEASSYADCFYNLVDLTGRGFIAGVFLLKSFL